MWSSHVLINAPVLSAVTLLFIKNLKSIWILNFSAEFIIKSTLSTHEIMLKILCVLTKRSWLNVFHSNKQAVKPHGILKLEIFIEGFLYDIVIGCTINVLTSLSIYINICCYTFQEILILQMILIWPFGVYKNYPSINIEIV